MAGKVLVTGGAGYVGSVLVPRLIAEGFSVRVLDLYLFGEKSLDAVKENPHLEQFKGDVRDQYVLREVLSGCDSVIHLACISNDPSFELNPVLGRSINFDAFEPLVRLSKENGVKRFIFASSSSVYGVSERLDVNEDHPLVPLTDYSKYKGLCEPILLQAQAPNFTTLVIRPATVCGYSPRQRFDLTVNLLTNHAVNKGRITVFGGQQKRPNLHIEDMVDLYVQVLKEPSERIAGKIFNVGFQNLTVTEIAETVRRVIERKRQETGGLEIVTTPSDDLRSYHISSEKIQRELGFMPKRSVENAVHDLLQAFASRVFHNPVSNSAYFNVSRMKEVNLV